jgi:uncharacterized protein YukE
MAKINGQESQIDAAKSVLPGIVWGNSAALIRFDSAYIREEAKTSEDARILIDEALSLIRKASAHDRWRCKERFQIDDDLYKVEQQLEKMTDDLSDISSALGKSADRFEELETRAARQEDELNADLRKAWTFETDVWDPGANLWKPDPDIMPGPIIIPSPIPKPDPIPMPIIIPSPMPKPGPMPIEPEPDPTLPAEPELEPAPDSTQPAEPELEPEPEPELPSEEGVDHRRHWRHRRPRMRYGIDWPSQDPYDRVSSPIPRPLPVQPVPIQPIVIRPIIIYVPSPIVPQASETEPGGYTPSDTAVSPITFRSAGNSGGVYGTSSFRDSGFFSSAIEKDGEDSSNPLLGMLLAWLTKILSDGQSAS